jgi:serine/threonine protein kinase
MCIRPPTQNWGAVSPLSFYPDAFRHNTERVARFQREARVLASLNHSNIAAIHELEEINKRHFLVMELVPGETLADRIARSIRLSSRRRTAILS